MTEADLLQSRLLLVDDQSANLALLETLLAREGFTNVVSTTDPQQALDLHTAFDPDLVMLDLMMPRLDGYAVLPGGEEFGHLVNSWGPDAHTGPVGWGEPGTEGFWADAGAVAGMLAAGDSWAFSHLQGFPAQKIDWRTVT